MIRERRDRCTRTERYTAISVTPPSLPLWVRERDGARRSASP